MARHALARRLGPLGLALLLTWSGAALAQDDEAEITFWQSVAHSDRPAEYEAYLEAYPNGRFAALARLHLKALADASGAAGTRAPVAPGKATGAWIRPTEATVRLVSGVTLDLDARVLRDSSNLRVAVMPATAPDAVADPAAFLEMTTSVEAARMHVTVPPGPPGRDEVRLYHIPRFASDYQVAARAPVTVGPGVPGAILSGDLVREAQHLGPLSFEARHRDRPLLVQAAFLRARPRTEWSERWFNGAVQEVPGRQLAVISIGQPGVLPDSFGSVGELVCVLLADSKTLTRLAALQTGDPVVVRAIPTSWDSAGASDPVVLDRCTLLE